MYDKRNKGILTQAKIDKRRSLQKGSRFAYAFDFINDSKNLGTDTYGDSASEFRYRNVLTPAGQSAAITGPSTQYN